MVCCDSLSLTLSLVFRWDDIQIGVHEIRYRVREFTGSPRCPCNFIFTLISGSGGSLVII